MAGVHGPFHFRRAICKDAMLICWLCYAVQGAGTQSNLQHGKVLANRSLASANIRPPAVLTALSGYLWRCPLSLLGTTGPTGVLASSAPHVEIVAASDLSFSQGACAPPRDVFKA